MFIRTQDRLGIVNMNNIKNIRAQKIVCTSESDATEIWADKYFLGKFKTEKKAIMVLEQICAFSEQEFFSVVMFKNQEEVSGNIFYMPEE